MSSLPAPPYCPPPAHALRTLYTDDALVVIDKPAGLLSVPGRGPEKTVCAQSITADRHGEVLVVHRLDMDTSGVMVFARSVQAQRHLSGSFERRETHKHYEAIVEGVLSDDFGTIDLPIARFSLQRPLRHVAPDGQTAITHWQVLARLADATRLRLTPHTGRSHQLRLHLRSIGHPILGDAFYGDRARADRLLLHATALSLAHPASGETCHFETPAPF